MKKNDKDMLDYIGAKMDAMDFDGDLNLNWDKDAHVFELEYTMTVITNQEYQIENQDGETAESGEVAYEDAVLFFDLKKIDGGDYAEDYLTVIPFAGKKGISQAVVDGFFDYFQEVLDDGESDLLDFVDGTSENDEFSVQFDQSALDAAIAKQPAFKADVFFAYPKY